MSRSSLQRARTKGRKAERAAVVVWLRREAEKAATKAQPWGLERILLRYLASCIEDGDHRLDALADSAATGMGEE